MGLRSGPGGGDRSINVRSAGMCLWKGKRRRKGESNDNPYKIIIIKSYKQKEPIKRLELRIFKNRIWKDWIIRIS